MSALHLKKELDHLKLRLLHLGAIAETSLEKVGYALKNLDEKSAQEVVEADQDADNIEVAIEEECLKILALHTPVANDLRFVVATLKINNDLERVCDLSVNIAERVKFLSKETPIPSPFDFDLMLEKTLKMVHLSLDSFVQSSVEIATQVCELDNEVDSMNRQVYKNVYAAIRENPQNVEILIHYLSISRHLERIADYATNICEDVIYMIDGRIVRHQPEEFHGKLLS